jgi:hypothetical protein
MRIHFLAGGRHSTGKQPCHAGNGPPGQSRSDQSPVMDGVTCHTSAGLAAIQLNRVTILHFPGQLELQTAALINQQLASMQPAADPEDDMAQEAPSVRVCLQMQQARD